MTSLATARATLWLATFIVGAAWFTTGSAALCAVCFVSCSMALATEDSQ